MAVNTDYDSGVGSKSYDSKSVAGHLAVPAPETTDPKGVVAKIGGRSIGNTYLELDGNWRTGTGIAKRDSLPEEAFPIDGLKVVVISELNLKSVPASLGRCVALTTLILTKHQLEAVPEAIATLVNLEHLALDDNRIRELPPFIGRLTNLQDLSVSDNPLENLPESLGLLTNLRHFTLQRTPIMRDNLKGLLRFLTGNFTVTEVRFEDPEKYGAIRHFRLSQETLPFLQMAKHEAHALLLGPRAHFVDFWSVHNEPQ